MFFDAKEYKEQLVAGMIYHVKYYVGLHEFVIVEIYQPLQSASDNNPVFRKLIGNYFDNDHMYGSSAAYIKAGVLATVSAVALLMA